MLTSLLKPLSDVTLNLAPAKASPASPDFVIVNFPFCLALLILAVAVPPAVTVTVVSVPLL